MDPAVVDSLGFCWFETTQGLIQDSMKLRAIVSHCKTEIVLIGSDTGDPKIRKPQSGNGITDGRDMGHHDIKIAVGQRKQPGFYRRHRVKVEVWMIDKQVIVGGMAINHAHTLSAQLPQVPDKAPVIPYRQGNWHIHISPGKQKRLFRSWGA